MFVIHPRPNYTAEAIARGIYAYGEGIGQNRRHQEELAAAAERLAQQQERYRILDERYNAEQAQQQERYRILDERYNREAAIKAATRQADAGLFMQMLGGVPQAEIAQGPTQGSTYEEQAAARAQGMQRLLSDPNLSDGARRAALSDYEQIENMLAQQEAARLATDALVKTRQMVIDSTRQGAIGEEQAAEVLPYLDPGKYLKDDGSPDISAMLKATADAESGMVAARKNFARQQTDDQTLAMFEQQFQTALAAATPAFEMGLYGQGEISEGLNEYNMLRLDWPQLDEQQRASRAKALIGKLDFKQRAIEAMEARDKARANDPRNKLQGELRNEFVTRGRAYRQIDPATGIDFGEARTAPMNFAAAEEAARRQLAGPSQEGFISPFTGPGGGQIAPGVNGPVPQQQQPQPFQFQQSAPAAPQGQAPAAAPAQAKPKTRDQYLGGDRGPAQAPEKMRAEVARQVFLGTPEQEAVAKLGLDLGSLTDEDWAEIERMVKALRAGKVIE